MPVKPKPPQTRETQIAALLLQGREMSTRLILFHQTLVGRFGLNATDHKCLDLARHQTAISPGQLAELTGLTTGAITAALDRLERAGFVARERDQVDHRKVGIRVLPKGQQKLAPGFASFARSMTDVLDRYDTAELEIIHDYQARCIEVFKKHSAPSE